MKSKATNKWMAEVFRRVGEWFLDLPEGAEINMNEMSATAEIYDGKCCGSPACVGGWLAVLYRTPTHYGTSNRFFEDGANEFAKELGFENNRRLSDWAEANPSIWGNDFGWDMFYKERAYSEGGKEYDNNTITVKAVGDKFVAVAGRLEKKAVIEHFKDR